MNVLRYWGVVGAAFTLLCVACTPPPRTIVLHAAAVPTIRSNTDGLFLQGHYAKALSEYEHEYASSTDPEVRDTALYGLACTQLVLARSEPEVDEAIANLEKWESGKGGAALSENPRLLVTALKFHNERLGKHSAQSAQLALLVKQKDAVINEQNRKITQLTTTIEYLQKQLDELEAIDEILQEKRKPL